MGSSGYVSKVEEWKEKPEETITAGKPNLLEGVEERTQHWILARSNLTEDGTLVYKNKKSLKFNRRQYKLMQNKDWVSFSLIRKMTNLKKLSVTLNTQDASAVLVLRYFTHVFSERLYHLQEA
jgi:hypothetical protein